ncbi:MAG: glycolate oxidase subunit GlcE [Burkholderiales bacterium]|nr:glycolate oxidase subunit GlcE [Burkholderiales bacterium]MDE2289043.1 glycolate oxidase subunit GlcE [Burkholderiales bacterium]MDE2611283.1 glycolate oxidase subunit GlcE [Burkholderiales bacterium]
MSATDNTTASQPASSAETVSDAMLAEFRARILEASAKHTPLQLRGGGTKDWYGEVPRGEVLDVSAYRGIVAYDPAELVITARCGTPLREIEAALAEKNQMLPFEPPHFGEQATFGGCIAAGLAGPRRPYTGAPRDFVLGVTLMNGRGEVLQFGGEVMKNVAGYDAARLMAGALGTLGLLLTVSIKVLPRPTSELTLQFELDQQAALHQLNEWAARPLPLSASAWQDGQLTLRLSGAQAAVEAARAALGGTPLEAGEAERWWAALREQTAPFFAARAEARPLWRLSVPSVAPALALPGPQLIEWGGAQRWHVGGETEAIRSAARQAGGHATCFRGPRDQPNAPAVFTTLPAPLMDIHRRLKEAFDPAGIFNPGRLYPDF